MNQVVVALFDVRSALFMQPFFVPAVGVAARQLGDEIKRGGENNVLSSHPDDFELYEVGSWDPIKGVLVAMERPKLLYGLHTLVG